MFDVKLTHTQYSAAARQQVKICVFSFYLSIRNLDKLTTVTTHNANSFMFALGQIDEKKHNKNKIQKRKRIIIPLTVGIHGVSFMEKSKKKRCLEVEWMNDPQSEDRQSTERKAVNAFIACVYLEMCSFSPWKSNSHHPARRPKKEPNLFLQFAFSYVC